MLVRSLGASFQADATMPRGLGAGTVEGPAFVQGAPSTVSSGGTTHLYIDEAMPGRYVQVSSSGTDYELRGTFLVVLYDVDYALTTAQGAATERTGRFQDAAVGGVERGRDQQDRVTLVDAVLRLHAPGGASLVSSASHVDFHGILTLAGDQPSIGVAGLQALPALDGGTARYEGTALLDLSPGEGGALAVASARAPASPYVSAGATSLSFLVVVALVVAAIAVIAVALGRRPRAREDDAAVALLAMEERRHADAVAPLTRALARDPHDAMLNLDLAICLEETGRREEARRQYEATIRLAPANAEALYYYARLLARLREDAESGFHLREALALDPRLEEMARAESAFRGMTGVSV
jgi:cbb3-type cytochrome oxidase subunit 3